MNNLACNMSTRELLLNFIIPEICASTWKAASTTRGSDKCIYLTQVEYELKGAVGIYQNDRDDVKKYIYDYLFRIYDEAFKQHVVVNDTKFTGDSGRRVIIV